MFGSDILEVAIGLSLVFALVSTICTAVREAIEAWLKTRASYLEYGIRQLLNDPNARGIAKEVFEHPIVSGLYIGNYEQGGEKAADAEAPEDPAPRRRLKAANKNLPSYIPSCNFAAALLDIVARGAAGSGSVDATPQPMTLQRLRGNLAHLDNPQLQRALLAAIDAAQGDLNRVKISLEAWYDSAMDRVSGWYKRTTHKMLLLISFLIAVILNVNTISITDYLFRHDTERSALIASFDAQPAGAGQPDYDAAKRQLNDMHLPIGWTGDDFASSWGAPRTRAERTAVAQSTGPLAFQLWEDLWAPLVGWLLTAFAATLGAPFWFDVLSKFMVVRSTVKPREKEEPGAATAPAPVAAATVAHHDDDCGVGINIVATADDELPAADGGVA